MREERDRVILDEMAEPKPGASHDVAVLCGPTEDGKGARILRARSGTLEAGEIRPTEDGQPLHGELVRLVPRADAPCVCDVEVLHDATRARRPEPGTGPSQALGHPAQVATEEYRLNWERIFGDSPGGADKRDSSLN